MGAPARPQAETAEGRWTLPAPTVGGSKRGTPGAGARTPPLPAQHAAGRAGPPPCPVRDPAVGGRRWVEARLRRAGCGQRRVERPLSHPPPPARWRQRRRRELPPRPPPGPRPRVSAPSPGRRAPPAPEAPARSSERGQRGRPRQRGAGTRAAAAGERASGRRGPGRARSAGAP